MAQDSSPGTSDFSPAYKRFALAMLTAVYALNFIDRQILVELQADGRLSNVQLAERVHLSPSACLRRVKQLEESGVIGQYSNGKNASSSRSRSMPIGSSIGKRSEKTIAASTPAAMSVRSIAASRVTRS